MKDLDYICLVFENICYLNVPATLIKDLKIDNCSMELCKDNKNNCKINIQCNSCYLLLDKSIVNQKVDTNSGLDSSKEILKYLRDYKNIAYIQFFSKDGNYINIYMPWPNNFNGHNNYQSFNYKNDNIEIMIKRENI